MGNTFLLDDDQGEEATEPNDHVVTPYPTKIGKESKNRERSAMMWVYKNGKGEMVQKVKGLEMIASGEYADTPAGQEASTEPDAPKPVNPMRVMVDAIATFDPTDKSKFNQDGKPNVEALEQATGFVEITADMRDAAWEKFKKDAGK